MKFILFLFVFLLIVTYLGNRFFHGDLALHEGEQLQKEAQALFYKQEKLYAEKQHREVLELLKESFKYELVSTLTSFTEVKWEEGKPKLSGGTITLQPRKNGQTGDIVSFTEIQFKGKLFSCVAYIHSGQHAGKWILAERQHFARHMLGTSFLDPDIGMRRINGSVAPTQRLLDGGYILNWTHGRCAYIAVGEKPLIIKKGTIVKIFMEDIGFRLVPSPEYITQPLLAELLNFNGEGNIQQAIRQISMEYGRDIPFTTVPAMIAMIGVDLGTWHEDKGFGKVLAGSDEQPLTFNKVNGGYVATWVASKDQPFTLTVNVPSKLSIRKENPHYHMRIYLASGL